jgi:hypothetical protein
MVAITHCSKLVTAVVLYKTMGFHLTAIVEFGLVQERFVVGL